MPKKQRKQRKRTPGQRFSIFYTKGDAQVRIRLFPFPSGYKVSAVRTQKGKPTERSVQEFKDEQTALVHIAELKSIATKSGYSPRVGTRGDNAALFG